jgi:hypothetical protein
MALFRLDKSTPIGAHDEATTERSRRISKEIWALIVDVPVAAGGFAFANSLCAISPERTEGFVCPLTGETLSCECCCSLNK